jgi:DNA-binding transcriptional ArsR family regulator
MISNSRTIQAISVKPKRKWFSAKVLTLCSADEKQTFFPYYLAIKEHHISGQPIDYKDIAEKAGCCVNSIRENVKKCIEKGLAYTKNNEANLYFVSIRGLQWKNKKKTCINRDGVPYSRKVKQYIPYVNSTIKALKLEIRNFMVANVTKRRRTALYNKFNNSTHPYNYCAVSGDEIARQIGRSRTTASRHLTKMKNNGLITITPMVEVIQASTIQDYQNLRINGIIPFYYRYKEGNIVRPIVNKIAFTDTAFWHPEDDDSIRPKKRKSFKKKDEEEMVDDSNKKEWFMKMPKGYFWKSYLINRGYSKNQLATLWSPDAEVLWNSPTGSINSVNRDIMSFKKLNELLSIYKITPIISTVTCSHVM